mmetsp:Transcript_71006/g.183101  ORF Transcript_71006/g.183101 Transcript_71006/m.183101 type:complete len:241 (+) Transcript_71006:265-987(+)
MACSTSRLLLPQSGGLRCQGWRLCSRCLRQRCRRHHLRHRHLFGIGCRSRLHSARLPRPQALGGRMLIAREPDAHRLERVECNTGCIARQRVLETTRFTEQPDIPMDVVVDLRHAEHIEASPHIHVLPKGIFSAPTHGRFPDSFTPLVVLQVLVHCLALQHLQWPMHAQPAVVQIGRRGHGAELQQRIPEPLWQEDRVSINLHHPLMALVPSLQRDSLPDTDENVRVEHSAPNSTFGDLE